MKILGISGSPRINGNTSQAVKHALALFKKLGNDTNYVTLANKDIKPCIGCFECRKGACINDDDMIPILEKLRNSDVIILGSPVYMGLITGQMKIFMDRTVMFRVGGDYIGQKFELSGKIGVGISCGGFRNGGQELTLQCLHTYFLQQNMVVIADGPPFAHSGAAIVGDVDEDNLGLETIANTIKNVNRFLNIEKNIPKNDEKNI